MYLAPTINDILDSNKQKFVGCIDYYTLARRLGKAFGYQKDLKFKVETFDDIDPDEFTVSGLFDMTTNTKYIILNFSKENSSITLSKHDFEMFKFLVSQCIQHETIHQHQWQHRDSTEDPVKLDFRNMIGTLNEEREYLSDKDEIDAYAHDIAMEIKYYYPKDDPISILRKIDKVRKIQSYKYYKNTFKGCSWFKIKKHLLLKTFKWIPHV